MRPSYNIAPTQPVAVCRLNKDGERELAAMRWGLVPRWSDDAASGFIHARSETAAQRPAFREALRMRRCLIPASGFYEWDQSTKRPYYIRLKNDRIFCLAGLWDAWGEGQGRFESAAVMTTRPNDTLARVHDRMPVILTRSHLDRWLRGESPDSSLFEPFPAQEMVMHEVTKRVNKPTADDADLIKPAPKENGGLFG